MSFKILDSKDFLIDISSVVASAWSHYSSSLTNFFTSSLQSNTSDSSPYYLSIYNSDPNTTPTSRIQFNIAYGDIKGSGSIWYHVSSIPLSPSRTVYGQFVNLLLGEDENASFNFGGSSTNENFYIITIDRAKYKQTIMPGSLQIRGLINNIYITDNSRITPIVDYTPAGRRYTLGSGSFGDGVMPPSTTTGIYGYIYPDIGVIILNPSSLSNVDTLRQGNRNNNNPDKLKQALTRFTLQSEETITSNYIFCRAQNHEFNFSTHPNFISSTKNITGSSNAILNDFIKTPPTYITSVGLYNDNQELLAVAKLSKPLKKDFTTEALIRVKLDF
jgi:hypothetical protein